MGWGFMKGLSQGMGGFAGVMGRQKEMDFQNRKDELAFKRQQSLEGMRAQANKENAQQKRDWQVEDQGKAEELRQGQMKQDELTYQKRRKEGIADTRSNAIWQLGMQKGLSDTQLAEKAAAKQETADQMHSQDWYKNLDQAGQDSADAKLMFNITLPKGSKAKAPTDGNLTMAREVLEGVDGFMDLPPIEQARQTRILGTAYANDRKQVENKLSGKGDLGKFSPTEDMPAIMDMVKSANSGDIKSRRNVEMAVQKLEAQGVPEKYISEIKQTLKPAKELTPMRPSMMGRGSGEPVKMSNQDAEWGY